MSDLYRTVLQTTGEYDPAQVAKAGRWAVQEIERLNHLLKVTKHHKDDLLKQNAKLQAVVDAMEDHPHFRRDCCCAACRKINKARAALEGEAK